MVFFCTISRVGKGRLWGRCLSDNSCPGKSDRTTTVRASKRKTIKSAIQAASGASCTESRTEWAEVFSPEAVKEAEVSSPTPVLDPWEGTSQQQTDEVSEILSALEEDISESEMESMKDCAACAFMANKIRQLKNKLKSLQNKLIAVRKERFFSRRTTKRLQAQKNLQTDQDQVETACSKESEPMEETASSTEGDTDNEDLDDGEEEEEMKEDGQSYTETEIETTETEDEDELKSNRLDQLIYKTFFQINAMYK
ncbi:PREDICTED: leucine zipper protein 2-like [Acropora digitifera]|uniref:leucine zipper protein 2-like n=1 Tax=Acropora digitifera TaxID=70779 RepID=UPI00077A7785|nr:PREDICTED: leucine zipper protein 2-like [Acropora digitifera]